MSSHSTAAGSPRTDAARATEELGGRLKLLSPSTLTASQRHLYDEMEKTVVPWARAAGFQAQIEDGRLIGPFNTAPFARKSQVRSLRCRLPRASTRRSASARAKS